MKPNNTRPVVSAILQKKINGRTHILLQTRWKPQIDSPYSGLLEIPAGWIEEYEDVHNAVKREVKEECGLRVVKFLQSYKGPVLQPTKGDKSFSFKPFLCQQVLSTRRGLPWVGFVFLCEVRGNIKMQNSEAKNPVWVDIKELEILLKKPKKFFPLQLPVLKYYLNWQKNKNR